MRKGADVHLLGPAFDREVCDEFPVGREAPHRLSDLRRGGEVARVLFGVERQRLQVPRAVVERVVDDGLAIRRHVGPPRIVRGRSGLHRRTARVGVLPPEFGAAAMRGCEEHTPPIRGPRNASRLSVRRERRQRAGLEIEHPRVVVVRRVDDDGGVPSVG